MKPCSLFLSCANNSEAEAITNSLFEKRLIVCAKRSDIHSSFLWNGKKESSNEVLLIMDSIEENFDEIQEEVGKIHSYENFVLFSMPIIQTTEKVKLWIKKELK